jgi:hypothetical protein
MYTYLVYRLSLSLSLSDVSPCLLACIQHIHLRRSFSLFFPLLFFSFPLRIIYTCLGIPFLIVLSRVVVESGLVGYVYITKYLVLTFFVATEPFIFWKGIRRCFFVVGFSFSLYVCVCMG